MADPVPAASAEQQQQQSASSPAQRYQIDAEQLEAFLNDGTKTVQCFPVVEGMHKAHPSVILNELSLVSASTTVKDLIRNAEYARHRWRRLNIFSDIEFNLEPLADGKPDDIVIRFLFTERKTFKEFSVMSSETGGLHPELKATLQNVMGRAYELSAHATPSSLKTLSYAVHLTSHTPYFGEKAEYILSRGSEQHPLHYGDQERVEQAKIVMHFDNSADIAAAESLRTNRIMLKRRAAEKKATAAADAAAASGDQQNAEEEEEEDNDEDEEMMSQPPKHWRQSVSFGFQRRRLVPKDATATHSLAAIVTSTSNDSALSWLQQQNYLTWRGVPSWLQHHFAPSTKCFLKYELRYSTVQHLPRPWYDVFSLPVSGTDFCGTAEVAGGLLGGSSSLAKAEVQCIHHRTLFPFVVLDLGLRGGFCAGLGGSEWVGQDARWGDSLALVDRFYLNWRNVRGFLAVGPNTNTEAEMRGEGDNPPRRFRCLGGNAVWAASATVNFPFPLWPSNGIVSSHIFANVGNLALMENAAHAAASLADFFGNPKASVGCGLTAMQIPSLGPVPNGRLELNFSLPVLSGEGGGNGTGVSLASPWVFDKIRWGLHWTSL